MLYTIRLPRPFFNVLPLYQTNEADGTKSSTRLPAEADPCLLLKFAVSVVYRLPWMVLGLPPPPSFRAWRLAAMACISWPIFERLMANWMPRLMRLPVPQ